MRNCIFRCNETIGKFQGYFQQEERVAGNGKSELDIISAALATYQSLEFKAFKYIACYREEGAISSLRPVVQRPVE